MDAELRELHEVGFQRLVLDLRKVTFLDVAALRLILTWADAVRADDARAFQVIPGPRHTQRIFDLTGTASRIDWIGRAPARRSVVQRLRARGDRPSWDRR